MLSSKRKFPNPFQKEIIFTTAELIQRNWAKRLIFVLQRKRLNVRIVFSLLTDSVEFLLFERSNLLLHKKHHYARRDRS